MSLTTGNTIKTYSRWIRTTYIPSLLLLLLSSGGGCPPNPSLGTEATITKLSIQTYEAKDEAKDEAKVELSDTTNATINDGEQGLVDLKERDLPTKVRIHDISLASGATAIPPRSGTADVNTDSTFVIKVTSGDKVTTKTYTFKIKATKPSPAAITRLEITPTSSSTSPADTVVFKKADGYDGTLTLSSPLPAVNPTLFVRNAKLNEGVTLSPAIKEPIKVAVNNEGIPTFFTMTASKENTGEVAYETKVYKIRVLVESTITEMEVGLTVATDDPEYDVDFKKGKTKKGKAYDGTVTLPRLGRTEAIPTVAIWSVEPAGATPTVLSNSKEATVTIDKSDSTFAVTASIKGLEKKTYTIKVNVGN